MALNDFFRISRNPLGLDIIVGAGRLQIRSGYIVLPQQTGAAEATVETGSAWNNSETGVNRQRDAGGVKDL
jgi:hypothetical protein